MQSSALEAHPKHKEISSTDDATIPSFILFKQNLSFLKT
jgi:hypothetical protein